MVIQVSTDSNERINNIIETGNLGIVIQCGGKGRRINIAQPKPLAILAEGDRPLTNILEDLPNSIPVYLHLLREQKEGYIEFLNPNGNFNHNIHYIIQQEGKLLDKNKNPLQGSDGTQVTASNGPATFIRHFVNPPEFLIIIDGAKLGIYFPDVIEALKVLVFDKSLDAIVFARELTNTQIESEKINYSKSHTRYARLNSDAQIVYEHPQMKAEIIDKKEWLALTGIYVIRSTAYMKKTGEMEGSFMKLESMNSLFEGFGYHLKTAMTLYGYNGRPSGLKFKTIIPTQYIPGIKTLKDIESYPKWKSQGVFDYKNKRNGENSIEKNKKNKQEELQK